MYRVGRSGRRLLARLFGGDNRRGQARTKRLEPLPQGGPTLPQTVASWRKLLALTVASFLKSTNIVTSEDLPHPLFL